jgi:hypothetical protein
MTQDTFALKYIQYGAELEYHCDTLEDALRLAARMIDALDGVPVSITSGGKVCATEEQIKAFYIREWDGL